MRNRWLLPHHIFLISPSLNFFVYVYIFRSPPHLPPTQPDLAICLFVLACSCVTMSLSVTWSSSAITSPCTGLPTVWWARVSHYPQKGNSCCLAAKQYLFLSSFRLFCVFALLKDKIYHSLTFPGAKLIQLVGACLSVAWSCTSVSQHCRTGHTVV